MNIIKYSQNLTSLYNKVQFDAAQGLLGRRVYKKVLDKTITYSLAITILFSLAAPAPLFPIFSIGAIGSFAYTIYKIYERHHFHKKAALLEPVFEEVRKGSIQRTYEQFQKKFPGILAEQKNGQETFLKLYSWGTQFPCVDFHVGTDPSRRGYFITRFNFNLLVLETLNKVTAFKYLNEKDYQDLTANIRYHGEFLRCGSTAIDEALELLEYAKTHPFLVGKSEWNTAKLLWDHLIDTFRELKPENYGSCFHLKDVRNYVLYLQRFYPWNGYEKLFAGCHSFEDFSRVANSIPKAEIAAVTINGAQKPQSEWKLENHITDATMTLDRHDLKAYRENNLLTLSFDLSSSFELTSFDYLWEFSQEGTLNLLIVPQQKCIKDAETKRSSLSRSRWENFTLDLQKFGQVKEIHIHGISPGINVQGSRGNFVQLSGPSIQCMETLG